MFRKKILVPPILDASKVPMLCFINDVFQVGLSSDLLDLWSIPLQPEPQTTRAFPYTKQFINDPHRVVQYKMRFCSEQYIWYAYARKRGIDLSLEYYCELPLRVITTSFLTILDNFVVLENEQLGIVPPDRLIPPRQLIMSNSKWSFLYDKICIKKSIYYFLIEYIKIILNSQKIIIKNLKMDLIFFIKRIIRYSSNANS